MQSHPNIPAGGDGLEPPFIQHNGRRDYRPWFKWRVVQESYGSGVSVSLVARKNNINSNVLFRWRAEYRKGLLKPPAAGCSPPQGSGAFIPVGIIGKDGRLMQPEACKTAVVPAGGSSLPVPARSAAGPGIIEFDLPSGVKVRFEAGVSLDVMRRALAVAKELK